MEEIYIGLNGKRYTRDITRGDFLGFAGIVTRKDLVTTEGPFLSAEPGDFVLVSPDGKRSLIKNSDRAVFWIEQDGKVFTRICGAPSEI